MLTYHDFTYACESDPFWKRGLIKSIEAISGKWKLWSIYKDYESSKIDTKSSARRAQHFWNSALDKLDIRLHYNKDGYANIPKTGALIIIANHPYGVMDGLAAANMISGVRDDYTILTNSVLCKAEDVRNHVLPIDFAPTKEAMRTNIQSRKAARGILKNEGCLVVFPAGGVSFIPDISAQTALDPAWQPFIAALIQAHQPDILPVFFEGQNSRTFQIASLKSQTLRTALFFRELVKRMNSDLYFKIGETIPYSDLQHTESRDDLCLELYRRVYALGGIENCSPAHNAFRIDTAATR